MRERSRAKPSARSSSRRFDARRRLMQSELGKWSSEHLALALDIFMGIVNDEAMVAAGRSKTSSEALGGARRARELFRD